MQIFSRCPNMREFSLYPLYSGDMTNFTINPTFQYPKAHFSLRGAGSKSRRPAFQHSLRGVGPTFRPVSPTSWKRGRRPIGGKVLNLNTSFLSGLRKHQFFCVQQKQNPALISEKRDFTLSEPFYYPYVTRI